MRSLLILALFASQLAAQTADLKTILDGNAATYAAVANLSYDYRDRQTPEEPLLPTRTEHGTYRALDEHPRFFDDEGSAIASFGRDRAKKVVTDRRRTVLNDHSLAVWFVSESNPVMIFDFEYPDAIPSNAYTIGFVGVEHGFHALAFGIDSGPLSHVIAPAGLNSAHRTEIVTRPDGLLELRVRYGTDNDVTRVLVVDPAHGYMVREHRVYDKDHTTLLMRMIATIAPVVDHPTVSFPNNIECWDYKHDNAAQPATLQDSWKASFSNVTIGTAKPADFTLEALGLPELIMVAHTQANGKIDTNYLHDGKLIDFDTMFKAGLAQKASQLELARSQDLVKARGW